MFLQTPNFTDEELTCLRAPVGQLPYTAPAVVVSERIRSGDNAGEDCRQRLDRAKMKNQVAGEVIAEMNAAKNK